MKFMFENSDVIFTENNEQIHQYSVNANSIEISFKDIDISYYTPYITFLRADGKTSPLIGMAFGDVVINGIGKRGAIYNFNDEWVTGVAGELKFNIVLKHDKTIINTGVITLYVNESIDNDKITYIDDVAYNALVDRIGTIEKNYVSLETFERRTEETVEFITKKIPYGDRTYVKFSHLTANNTIENLYDALGDYNYITEDNVEYKFYIELGDGTILENIHIKSYSGYYDITSIIRNGIQFKVYMGRIWFNNPTSTITEFIAQHSQIVNYKDIENLVNYEALGDALDGIKELIPYGDRKYHYSFNLTAANTISELIDELKSDEMFDENNEGKFYIKLSDDTVLENIHIKLKYLTKPERKTVYYINSIIREKNNIKIYIATLNDSSVLTISELIAQHSQIATMQDIANLVNSAPETLDTLGEIANALKENEDVVEALNKAITNKADITYVDENYVTLETLNTYNDNLIDYVEEKVANAGGGGDLGVEITYNELVALRNNSQLSVGTNYIITDYQCTTTQENIISANHQFDIIVVADSENTLNENARARLHKGDTYFANNNLSAWELKYSLDNDVNRFEWANVENGKGVIYYMKDEFNNECPYDFKNIIYVLSNSFVYYHTGYNYSFYKTYEQTKDDGKIRYWYKCDSTPSGFITNECYTFDSIITPESQFYMVTNEKIPNYGSEIINIINQDYTVYTFHNFNTYAQFGSNYNFTRNKSIDIKIGDTTYYGYTCDRIPTSWNDENFYVTDMLITNNSVMYRIVDGVASVISYDGTLTILEGDLTIDGYNNNVYNNVIKSYKIEKKYKLNKNTFEKDTYENTLGNNCYNNKFNRYFINNTIGNNCYNNNFKLIFNGSYIQNMEISSNINNIDMSSLTSSETNAFCITHIEFTVSGQVMMWKYNDYLTKTGKYYDTTDKVWVDINT